MRRLLLVGVLAVVPGGARGQQRRLALGSAARAAIDSEDAGGETPLPEDLPRIQSERDLRHWIRTWPNMRVGHPFEIWSWDPDVVPRLRSKAVCLGELRAKGVRFEVEDPSPLVPFAVKVRRVPGLSINGRDLVISCEMASRLPALASILNEHGFSGVTIMSAWRSHPHESFHTLGLALDLARFTTQDGEILDVEDDYVKSGDAETCAVLAPEGKARRLQALACSLFASRAFSTVLTPNYNHGHRHHFHVDIRPADERFYLR